MIQNKRLNVLLSAFSCIPGKGGEPGVGWNFSKNMAIHHNVWVLTRRQHKQLIDDELSRNPVENLFFIYYDLATNSILNEKLLGEQAYYIMWQIGVLSAYKKAAKKVNFDLIHHLTYNQYRSPSIGFFVKKPFIIGPIGGSETISPSFYQDLFFKGKLKEAWRKWGLDIYLFLILCKLKTLPKKIIFSSERSSRKLNKYLANYELDVIPSIAIDKEDFNHHHKIDNNSDNPFTIIYAGTAKDWKGLLILLRAVKLAFHSHKNILVKLIGIRDEIENQRVSQWIEDCDLSDKVQLIKFLPRKEVIKELSNADISVYPAFRDSGSMAVLEACALGCTVVCFDAGGQDAFPDHVILKIPVSDTSYETNLANLSEKLKWCYDNPVEVNKIGHTARDYVFRNYTWQQKVSAFSKLYINLLSELKPYSMILNTDIKSDTV